MIKNKKFWKRWGIFTAILILLGVFWVECFPSLFGWIAGNAIGSLFADFLARHDFIYRLTESLLRAGSTVCVVAGLDFVFLILIYRLLDDFVTKQGTWIGIIGVSFRALRGLLKIQILVGVVILAVCFKKQDFSSLWFVPPFLTEGLWETVYMSLWELSLLLFAFGFAMTENWLSALRSGLEIAKSYFWLIGIFLVAVWSVTFLPVFMLGSLSFPTWVWTILGVALHLTLTGASVFVLCKKTRLFELAEK